MAGKKMRFFRLGLIVTILGTNIIFFSWGLNELGAKTVTHHVSLTTDFTHAPIKPDALIQGCPEKDCMPSVDEPVFIPASEVRWLSDEDVVFVIRHKGAVKAYPQRVLNWHGVVNDTIGSVPVSVTFCPLCGSVLAYIREVNGSVTELGVSGKLYNSNLVLYDRLEGNLWAQMNGEALAGPAAGRKERLKPFPVATTTWRKWTSAHPDTPVLSRKTGYERNYAIHPYGDYERTNAIYFPVEKLDISGQRKEMVYGVVINNIPKAYPVKAIHNGTVVQDVVGGVPISFEQLQDGAINVTNTKTGTAIQAQRMYRFAWYAFYPDSGFYTVAD